MNTIDENEKLIFTFAGDNSINAYLLIKSLDGIIATYKEIINSQYSSDEIIADINIEAFNKGSFEVVIAPILSTLPSLLPRIPEISLTIKTFLNIVKLKRDLKGEFPKEIEQNGKTTKITNTNGEVSYHDCNITNIYLGNQVLDSNIASIFEPLNQGNKRNSIQFKSGNEETTINKDQYLNMSKKIIEKDENIDSPADSKIINVDLLLKRPDLFGKAKWDFLFNGKKISAAINDECFLGKVRNSEIRALYNGVKIPCELKIEIFLDENLDITSKKYTIVSVTGNIIEPKKYEQLTFS